MRNKGLVALLDGLLAYTIAFTAVGLITLLIVDLNRSDTDTGRSLNLLAADLADTVAVSMTPDPTHPELGWRDTIEPIALSNLNTSLTNIALERGISIRVLKDNQLLSDIGDVTLAKQVTTAERFLMDVNGAYLLTGNVSVLTVMVGI
jgi:hypothetical protein